MPVILVPLDEGQEVPLEKAVMFFGRHPDCDVVLTNSRKVSRKHCCIAQINDHFVVRDLGSMNGVRINGRPAGKEAQLKIGDEVWIGDVRYRMEARAAERSKPKPAVKDQGVRKVTPEQLSRDVPIAIPEDGEDFVVEETRPKLKRDKSTPADEVIVLSDDDILG